MSGSIAFCPTENGWIVESTFSWCIWCFWQSSSVWGILT
jgi:hypothetical protein